MFANMFNQTATLKTKISTNKYGENSYTSSTIKLRFEVKLKLTRNSEGKEIMSAGRVFTASPLSNEDLVIYSGRNYTVISVEPCIGIDGRISHYEAYVV